MQGGAATATRPVNKRAALTNDPRRLSVDVDMRGVDGRRFADIFDALAGEFPSADPARIREIAVLKFASEKALSAGAWEDVVRLANTVERKERALRLSRRMISPPSLHEHLSKRSAERARKSLGG